MQADIEMYYYKVIANEMKSYEQRNRQTNGTDRIQKQKSKELSI